MSPRIPNLCSDHPLLRRPAFENRRTKIELARDRPHRGRNDSLKSLVVDLVHLIDAGQAGRKLIDVDQELPHLLDRNIQIDFAIENHREFFPLNSRAILCEKNLRDKYRGYWLNVKSAESFS